MARRGDGRGMEIWKAAVLGAVQGLTEFLPVSSSGHLILLGRLLGAGGGMFFDVMLHGGTLIAVVLAYAPRLARLWKSGRKTLLYLLWGTVPAALAGAFLGDFVDEVFFGGEFLWAAFLLTALLLLLAELRLRQNRPPRPLGARSSFAVGASQALALVPGLSRSGATLSAGVFAGLSREDAADFSFLLSIPIIAGAMFVQLVHAPVAAEAVSWQALAVGGLCALAFGFASVRLMLRAVRRAALWPFAAYLFALSAVLVCLRFALPV